MDYFGNVKFKKAIVILFIYSRNEQIKRQNGNAGKNVLLLQYKMVSRNYVYSIFEECVQYTQIHFEFRTKIMYNFDLQHITQEKTTRISTEAVDTMHFV